VGLEAVGLVEAVRAWVIAGRSRRPGPIVGEERMRPWCWP
jgi:hypothetical protein